MTRAHPSPALLEAVGGFLCNSTSLAIEERTVDLRPKGRISCSGFSPRGEPKNETALALAASLSSPGAGGSASLPSRLLQGQTCDPFANRECDLVGFDFLLSYQEVLKIVEHSVVYQVRGGAVGDPVTLPTRLVQPQLTMLREELSSPQALLEKIVELATTASSSSALASSPGTASAIHLTSDPSLSGNNSIAAALTSTLENLLRLAAISNTSSVSFSISAVVAPQPTPTPIATPTSLSPEVLAGIGGGVAVVVAIVAVSISIFLIRRKRQRVQQEASIAYSYAAPPDDFASASFAEPDRQDDQAVQGDNLDSRAEPACQAATSDELVVADREEGADARGDGEEALSSFPAADLNSFGPPLAMIDDPQPQAEMPGEIASSPAPLRAASPAAGSNQARSRTGSFVVPTHVCGTAVDLSGPPSQSLSPAHGVVLNGDRNAGEGSRPDPSILEASSRRLALPSAPEAEGLFRAPSVSLTAVPPSFDEDVPLSSHRTTRTTGPIVLSIRQFSAQVIEMGEPAAIPSLEPSRCLPAMLETASAPLPFAVAPPEPPLPGRTSKGSRSSIDDEGDPSET